MTSFADEIAASVAAEMAEITRLSTAAKEPKNAAMIAALKQGMDADWTAYHWVRETHDDWELLELLQRTGSVEAALADARSTSDLLDERCAEVRSL